MLEKKERKKSCEILSLPFLTSNRTFIRTCRAAILNHVDFGPGSRRHIASRRFLFALYNPGVISLISFPMNSPSRMRNSQTNGLGQAH